GDYTGSNTAGINGGGTILEPVSAYIGYPGVSASQPDIQIVQLIRRSMAILRKFFPKLVLSTTGPVFPANSPLWYDFNRDGGMGLATPQGNLDPRPYILQGHECLVFFLGGVPLPAIQGKATTTFSMTGFGKDPANPFSNSLNNGNTNYSANRQPPFFEFNAGR